MEVVMKKIRQALRENYGAISFVLSVLSLAVSVFALTSAVAERGWG